MEDVYTIKVKTKPDTRNVYPSERRYSASTVSGLAWVHLALAATALLLACLALVNPHSEIKRLTLDEIGQRTVNASELVFNVTESVDGNATLKNATDAETNYDNCILVIAPMIITVFATAAGIASIVASVRWYIDHNITWLFIMSTLSTLFSLVSLTMIIVWFVTTSDTDFSEFYKDKIPFKDHLVVKHSDVLVKNDTHMLIGLNSGKEEGEDSYVFTKRVLSINIMIAAFLELLWSILSVKISYKGMKSSYKEQNEPRSSCIAVVTTIKGNTKKLPRNAKILPPKPVLIEHYPSKKVKRIFLEQSEGFYLKNQESNDKDNTETSELYKERMMNFLDGCASMEGQASPGTPVQPEAVLNTIPEATSAQINQLIERDMDTPVSWGDSPDHTVYNQNTINFEKIFVFGKQDAVKESEAGENVK